MITAFVPTYNSGRTLKFTLQSIKAQSIPLKRIIVIDSGSNDNTEQIAKNEGVEFYKPQDFGFDFLGLGKARNRILDLVDTPYLLSVDSDVVLEKDYIKKLFPYIEDNSEIAGVAGKQIELNRFFLPDKLRAVIEMRDLYIPLKEQKTDFRDFLLGSNNIYRIDALKKIANHPFDDNLTTNYEDVDIGKKLRKQGYKLLWTPSVVTYHLQKDNLYSFIDRAYRYRFFKWKLKNAFYDLDIYKGKIEHNFNYAKMGFDIALEKNRQYLTYPYFLIIFYFFLKDAEIFKNLGKREIFNGILNCFYQALERIKNAELKNFIINDLKKMLHIDKPTKPGIKLDEIEHCFLNLYNIDENILLISRKRIDFENQLKMDKKKRILILNMENNLKSSNYETVEDSICKNKKILDLFYNFQNLEISSWIINAAPEKYNKDEIFYEILGYKPDTIYINGEIDLKLKEKIKVKISYV